MAEGGSVGSSTSVRGSDETFLYSCDPCQYDGTLVEGIRYCQVCDEFLCNSCSKAHKKSKALRGHKLLEGSEIHKARKVGTQNQRSRATDLCKLHKDNSVQFYCHTHDEVFCYVCRTVNHRKCDDVKIVDDVYAGAYGDQDIARIKVATRSLLGKFKSLRLKRRGALDELARQKNSCFRDIKKFREALMKRLDQIETDMHTEINTFVSTRSSEISNGISTLEHVSKVMEEDVKQLESASGAKNVFVAIKNVGLSKLTDVCTELDDACFKTTIIFNAEGILDTVLDKDRLFGCLSLLPSTINEVGPKLVDDVRDKSLIKTGDCNVSHEDDMAGCDITGLEFLPDGGLVVCDSRNQKLKFTDDRMCAQSSLELPGRPWGVALLGDKEAVVTMPDKQKLQFVTVGEQLTLGRDVEMGRRCYGIAFSKDQLYVSCFDESGAAEVLVLNKRGAIQTRIANSQGQSPYFIAVDGQGSIFLSDSGSHTVTRMTSAGQTVYTYKDEGLQYPGQLLVDTKQYVYVCGGVSNTVQVITDRGRQYKNLLNVDDGTDKPWCLAYRNSDKTLAIGPEYGDSIALYRFQ